MQQISWKFCLVCFSLLVSPFFLVSSFHRFQVTINMSTQQTGTATLMVDNFSQLVNYQRTEFTFAGLSYFGIRPQADLPQVETDNIFVYWLNNKKISAKVHFKVSIMSESDEKLYTLDYNFEFDDSNRYPLITFISRAKLVDPKNGYLVNGRLNLLCEAEIINKEAKNLESTLQQELNNLSENLQSLLSDGKFSDATLTVGTDGKQFHVHKNILASRSPVFGAMFEHDCEEKLQNQVNITDMDQETCGELLRFIYTGKVKQMDRYALDLLVAADKYQLDSLKNICEHFLCSTLSIESSVNVLFIADLHRATKLKDKCLEYICDNINQVKDTDGWNVLERNSNLLCNLLFYSANKNK